MGRHHVQAAMGALVIVQVNILLEIFQQVVPVVDWSVLQVFVFQDTVRTFHESVVVATVAHADEQFMFFDFIGVFKTAVLGTLVRVVDEQVIEPAHAPFLHGHLECLQIGLGKHPVRGVPPQDFAGVHVFYQDDVEPGVAYFEVGDVTDPKPVDVIDYQIVQQIGVGLDFTRMRGLVELGLDDRLETVRHAKPNEGIPARKVRLQFHVELFERHGGVLCAFGLQDGAQQQEPVRLRCPALDSGQVGLFGGSDQSVELLHLPGVLVFVLAEPFEGGPLKVFFRSIFSSCPPTSISFSR